MKNKNYLKFYPIKSEEDKNIFLSSYYKEIYEMLTNISRIRHNYLSYRRFRYISKMKPTVSIVGLTNYKNIIYNERLYQHMMLDKKIKIVEEKIVNIDSLLRKLSCNEKENITAEEINYALKIFRTDKKKNMTRSLLLIAAVSFCISCF